MADAQVGLSVVEVKSPLIKLDDLTNRRKQSTIDALKGSLQDLLQQLHILEPLYDQAHAERTIRNQHEAYHWVIEANWHAPLAGNMANSLVIEAELQKRPECRPPQGKPSLKRYVLHPSLLFPPRNRVRARQIEKVSRDLHQLCEEVTDILTSSGEPASSSSPPPPEEEKNWWRWPPLPPPPPPDKEDDTLYMLEQRLLDATVSHRSVLSIVGRQGTGKTTLGRRLYHSNQASAHFDIRIWVSELHGGVDYKLKTLKQLSPMSKDSEHNEIVERLHQSLDGKRYLIVLDHKSWHGFFRWEDLSTAFPDSGNGSRVLVISAKDDNGAAELSHTVPPLNQQQSWELFLKTAFPSSSSPSAAVPITCPEDVQDIGQELAKRCKGHPPYLKIVGGLASTRSSNRTEWTQLLHAINYSSSHPSFYNSISSVSKTIPMHLPTLSYTELPNNYIRSCLLYLSWNFRNTITEASLVISMWMAEGLIIPQPHHHPTMEETAQAYLAQMVRQNMIEVISTDWEGNTLTCRVEYLFYSLCQRELEEKRGTPNQIKISNFRVLLPNFRWGIHSIERSNPYKYMLSLRYLSFNGTAFKNLTELPLHICYLPHLQTLDIRNTGITQLPTELGEMKTLTNLYMSDSAICPPSIGSLTQLQTLETINAIGEWMEDLGQLTNIQVLGITGIIQSHWSTLSDALGKLENLSSLYLSSREPMSTQLLDLGSLSTKNSRLQKLHLYGQIKEEPGLLLLNNTNSPINLTVLTLDGSKLKQDPMETLGVLPCLAHLALKHGAYAGKEMLCQKGHFPKLRRLELQGLRDVVNWRVEQGSMPGLASLSIVMCDRMAMLPAGLEDLEMLQELVVIDPRVNFLYGLLEDTRIKHVPSVKFNP